MTTYTRTDVLALRAASEEASNNYRSVWKFNTDPARRADLPRLEAIADAAYAELCRVRDIVAAAELAEFSK
jgi:hypothetical protein